MKTAIHGDSRAIARTTCISLIRVSGTGQLKGDGPERQRETIRRFAESQHLDIVYEVFGNKSQSGSVDVEDRVDLVECLIECEERGVNLVLIEDYHRLGRDLLASELAARLFRDAGIQILCAANGIDLTAGGSEDPTAQFVRTVLAAAAQMDKDMTVLKLRVGRARKRKATGRCEGPLPFGEKEGERGALRVMLHMENIGYSTQDIVNNLNDQGFVTRNGHAWNRGSVWRILKRQQSLSAARAQQEV